jgi:transcriptional regulator with XRE-family HTH domain
MKAGLTQTQLAARAKTSQQQIQRIEAGQSVRLELASAICAALKVPLEKVFPGTKAPAKRSRRGAGQEVEGRLANAGIGTDDLPHDLLITFRNGMRRFWKLTDVEARQAVRSLRASPDRENDLGPKWMRFVLIETETHTAVVNPEEIAHVASGWDVLDDAPDVPEELNVYLIGSTEPLQLWTAADPERPEDLDTDSPEDYAEYEQYMEEAPVQHALRMLDGEVERADFMHLPDQDGAVHSVKYGCIALLEIPYEYQGYVEDREPEPDAERATVDDGPTSPTALENPDKPTSKP